MIKPDYAENVTCLKPGKGKTVITYPIEDRRTDRSDWISGASAIAASILLITSEYVVETVSTWLLS